MKIYVASSWRNEFQQDIVSKLREAGHNVYDFRHPEEKDNGFHWSEIDINWQDWNPEAYKSAIEHPIACSGFKNDFDAMQWADTCVIVLPCGRPAHTEAGWMKGQGKKTYLLLLTKQEPELMYKLFDEICLSIDELISVLNQNHLEEK